MGNLIKNPTNRSATCSKSKGANYLLWLSRFQMEALKKKKQPRVFKIQTGSLDMDLAAPEPSHRQSRCLICFWDLFKAGQWENFPLTWRLSLKGRLFLPSAEPNHLSQCINVLLWPHQVSLTFPLQQSRWADSLVVSYWLLKDLTISPSLGVLGISNLLNCKPPLAPSPHFQGLFSWGVTLPPCFFLPPSVHRCVILLGDNPKYSPCLPLAAVLPCRVGEPHLTICWGKLWKEGVM